MHLHAVLGFSFTPLASAMLLHEVEQVTLYCDDKQRADIFDQNLKKLFSKRKKGKIPISIVTIPTLSEGSGGDMLSMLESLCKQIESLGFNISEQDVLFYSGTPAHLFAFIRLFGFKRLMTFEYGPLIEIVGANEHRKIEDFFDLSLDEVLRLHNISEQICRGNKSAKNGKKWDARYVDDIFLEGAAVVFEYVPDDYQVGGNRRRFCQYVRRIESHLGRYGVKHRVDNEMLSLWLRNTQLPPPLLDIGGEEE